jgi:hypothetical protein
VLRRLLVGAALLIVVLLLAAWLLSYFRTGKTHLGKPPAQRHISALGIVGARSSARA